MIDDSEKCNCLHEQSFCVIERCNNINVILIQKCHIQNSMPLGPINLKALFGIHLMIDCLCGDLTVYNNLE